MSSTIAAGDKFQEMINDESFFLQQDIDESLEMNESKENETSSIQKDNIHPTENETLFIQESIPNNESNTTEEDDLRKEDVEDYMNEKYGKRNHTFNLQLRRWCQGIYSSVHQSTAIEDFPVVVYCCNKESLASQDSHRSWFPPVQSVLP